MTSKSPDSADRHESEGEEGSSSPRFEALSPLKVKRQARLVLPLWAVIKAMASWTGAFASSNARWAGVDMTVPFTFALGFMFAFRGVLLWLAFTPAVLQLLLLGFA